MKFIFKRIESVSCHNNISPHISIGIARNKFSKVCKGYQYGCQDYKRNNNSANQCKSAQFRESRLPDLFKSIVIINCYPEFMFPGAFFYIQRHSSKFLDKTETKIQRYMVKYYRQMGILINSLLSGRRKILQNYPHIFRITKTTKCR